VIERSRAELSARELVPFRMAIDAGARVAMAGHLAVPALTGRRDIPATISPAVVTDLLRNELRFRGLAVSDALDMGAVTGGPDGGVDVSAALGAGTDLLLCGPDPAAQARVEAGLAAAARGVLDASQAAASAAHLAELQDWLAGSGGGSPDIDVVGCAEHQALAAAVASRSITLVRDRVGRIPVRVAASARILVVEPRPRDLTPADTTSSIEAGGLFRAIHARHRSVVGHLVDGLISADEISAICDHARSSDLVVVGTVDGLGQPSVRELAAALVETAIPVIAIALRGPWDADAYPEVGTVIATYGVQPPTLAALAAALFGDAKISGRLPVRLRSGDA
jgi:beta-N-acetylhexosaminidase